MSSTAAVKLQDDKFGSLGLSKIIENREQIAAYGRLLGSSSERNPILVLIHGYPQSSYMYIHASRPKILQTK